MSSERSLQWSINATYGMNPPVADVHSRQIQKKPTLSRASRLSVGLLYRTQPHLTTKPHDVCRKAHVAGRQPTIRTNNDPMNHPDVFGTVVEVAHKRYMWNESARSQWSFRQISTPNGHHLRDICMVYLRYGLLRFFTQTDMCHNFLLHKMI